MQQLQIENTKLEAELKFEKQRADMLYQDLQDSQKVRSSLEALCANLKSSSAHLEDRLGIADLEKNKHNADTKLEQEMTRANFTDQKLKHLEQQLEFEKDRNQHLQKNVTTLKLHLKSAKNKMTETGGLSLSDPQYTEFQKDVFSKETFVSTPREQAHPSENLSDVKAELEAKYRKELNRKLSDVNKFLESQSHLRDKLDNSRTDLETNLLFDKRKLEEEITNLRVKYEQAVAQRETKEMEAKRFRELYESEMKWRIRVNDQLQLATEKSCNLQSKLSNERHHRSRITGSIGNLNSSVVSSNGFNFSRMNGFQDDELSSKIKAELDRSISKHLEAAPHDLTKPVIRPMKETERFSSSLAQSSSDYFNILKQNLSDVKAELEAKYRKELNRKLSDVNKFLESQSHLRDKLDNSRTDLETNLLFDKRKLEEEITNLRVKYEQAVAQRETKEMEAKRFRELYESEMKWRLRVSDQLQLATEKSCNLQSKLSNERHHRSRITGSIGNLNSSVVSSNGFNFSRMNGFQDDELSSKIKAELDRSIAKHLEA
ncbi:hypothetical protein Btru_066685, partial [Bulinus truncatus]